MTGRVVITDDIRAQLRNHRTRTCIETAALLQGGADAPPGLNPAMIDGWLSGKTKTARKDHLDYVLRRWETIPIHAEAKPGARAVFQHPVIKTGYRTEELTNHIRAARESMGMSKGELARRCGVTRGTINQWEIRRTPLRAETATRIAQALGSEIEALFPGGVKQTGTRDMPRVSAGSPPCAPIDLKALAAEHQTDAPNAIRLVRGARGMGLRHLAERLGTSVTTVHNLEVGKIHTSPAWCQRLGAALDCPPAYFENKKGSPYLGYRKHDECPNNVRAIRKKAGLKQRALAERLNINPSVLHNLEVGKLLLSESWIERLAEALQCDPQDFVVHEAPVPALHPGQSPQDKRHWIDDPTFPQAVKQARRAAQLTLRGLAEKSGASIQQIHELESRGRNPGPDVLARIVAVLGLSMPYD